MWMPPKRPIRGSGNAGAVEAPKHGVNMETPVVVVTAEVLLDVDIIDGVVLLQPEPEVENDSADDSGDNFSDDSGDHSSDDADDDG
ncbi:E3 ubiquitin-protein ligase [Hordeum vulgare]|nr:E3 ubiquitin-protein ligase [Hordeum vulgare]